MAAVVVINVGAVPSPRAQRSIQPRQQQQLLPALFPDRKQLEKGTEEKGGGGAAAVERTVGRNSTPNLLVISAKASKTNNNGDCIILCIGRPHQLPRCVVGFEDDSDAADSCCW